MKLIVFFGALFVLVGMSFGSFKVTEVFVDGTQEYIEIYYQGEDDFTGEITIEGVKSSSHTITITHSILSGTYMVIGDSLVQLKEKLCQIFDNQGLSLVDSRNVNISLSWSGGYSQMSIDQDTLTQIDNQKRSFIYNEGMYQPVTNQQTNNTTVGYFGSPCLGDSISGQELPLVATGSEDTGTGSVEHEIGSGIVLDDSSMNSNEEEDSTTPGDALSGSEPVSSISDELPMQCPIGTNEFLGNLSIAAVSPKNGTLADEFLVLTSTETYSGTISVVGGGRGAKTSEYRVYIKPGIPYIIGSSGIGFTDVYDVLIDESLSLTDSGEELILKDASGKIHDTVSWFGSESDRMIFGSNQFEGTTRLLTIFGTTKELFTAFEGVSCDFISMQNTLSLSNTQLCALPGESNRLGSGITVLGCEGGVGFTTGFSGEVIYEKKLGTITICSNSIHIASIAPETQGELINETIDSISGDIAGSGSLRISEISPKDGYFPEYIELQILGAYSGRIEILGAGHGSSIKEVVIHAKSSSRIVVTDTEIPSLSGIDQIIIDSLSLTDGGERLEVRQGGQLIDTVFYSGSISSEQAWNRGENDQFSLGKQTPGFALEMIEYLLPLPGDDLFSCSIRVQNTDSFTANNKLNLVASVDGKDITNSSSYGCVRSFDSLEYGSDMQEEFRCNPGYLSFPFDGLFEVTLTMTNTQGNRCYASSSVNAPPGSADGSSSDSSGKSGYYQKLYQKRKERFTLLKSNIKPYGLTTNASGSVVIQHGKGLLPDDSAQVSLEAGIVKIVKVLPNPAGADRDQEVLVLHNITDQILSTAGWKLHTGKSNKSLPEVELLPGEDTKIIGSLGLVNSNRCIALLGNEKQQYDSFCYGKAADDQWFEQSDDGIEKAISGGSLVINDLKIIMNSGQSCIHYQGSPILCKDLPIDSETLKQLKKESKGYQSLEKKYTKELVRRKASMEQLKEQKKKTTQVRKDYQKRLKNEKLKSSAYYQDIKKQKHLTTIHRGLITLRKNYLHNEYRSLYLSSEFETAWNAYRTSLDGYYNDTEIQYGPIILPSTDIETITAYLEGASVYDTLGTPRDIIPSLQQVWDGYFSPTVQ